MFYKEYKIPEEGFRLEGMESEFLSREEYSGIHESMPILCHDVFIKYNEGILLVERDNEPGRRLLFPVGGRLIRGVSLEESLKRKVKEECSLSIKEIKMLGVCRCYFSDDPFGHGKGTDAFSISHFAEGDGRVRLDGLHSRYTILDKENYLRGREKLIPYVKDYIEEIISRGLIS